MPRRDNVIQAPRSSTSRGRVLIVSVALLAWMVAIGARLVQLQHNQHDELALRARNQQLGSIETSPTRGQVLDRQGRELARSIDTESFFADPRDISNTEETARRIATITRQDPTELSNRLREAKASNKMVVWITRRLDSSPANKIDVLELS